MTTEPSSARLVRGRYEIRSRIGKGGMGSVWLASDRLLGRSVALKEISLSPSGNEPLAVQRERALREARAAAQIEHCSIAEIHDVFEEDGVPWIVMAYVEGDSLKHRIGERVLAEQEIASMGRGVLAGLMAAHAAGVVHRDVKPANILIGRTDQIFLVDFGIARITGESGITAQHHLIGTPEFMAPERANGLEGGPPSDLWSLGVTLFYALEGYSPFRRDTWPATLHAVTAEGLPSPMRPGALFDAIAALLKKDPARRMGAAELDRRLQAILEPPRVRVRRTLPKPRAEPGPPPQGSVDGRGAGFDPESVRDGDPMTGGRLLLARSAREVASLLDTVGPKAAGPLLDVIARQPAHAVAALTLLPYERAANMINFMSAAAAATVLRSMPAGSAASTLVHVDDRAAADIIGVLGASVTAIRLLEAMTMRRACQVLTYVPPKLTAALLAASSDGRGDRLLSGLSAPVRAQVARLMSPRRRSL